MFYEFNINDLSKAGIVQEYIRIYSEKIEAHHGQIQERNRFKRQIRNDPDIDVMDIDNIMYVIFFLYQIS